MNYVLITKYALKKYSLRNVKQFFLLLTVWFACAVVAFTHSMFIDLQSLFCVLFIANQTSSYVPILFNTLFIVYLTTCDVLMMYLYVLVCRCLQTSAIQSGRSNTSCVKLRNRAVTSCFVSLSSTVGTLLLSSRQFFNHQFGVNYELYIIMIMAVAPLSNPFIYTLSNKLGKHQSKHD